ncbi:XdhC/CoxI family protein [Streptomyces werraensis]|uniref:XdhC/CoxI family protein n=1 Tax=Streptomyces werraensis TaxID=68284 RepID=A0ABV3JPF9_9ACTN
MSSHFDIWDTLYGAWLSGETSALATVVRTRGSAPRPTGSVMLLTPEGRVMGSVSGGCVEGDVVERARETILTGIRQQATYGIGDDDAVALGLTCGGTLDVLVEPVDVRSFPELAEVVETVRAGTPVAVATVLNHPRSQAVGAHVIVRADGYHSSSYPLDAATDFVDDARNLMHRGESGLLTDELTNMRVLVRSFVPQPRMLLFGAGDFAAALASIGRAMDYRVTVCDARPLFATADRFPDADDVVVAWPDEYLTREATAGRVDPRTVIVSFSHDAKFDLPLLETALQLDVAFVGALGSRATRERRVEALRESGVPDDALARLSSPVGLDLGGHSPAETAISIAAEIIAVRYGGRGERLSHRDGPVHLLPHAV